MSYHNYIESQGAYWNSRNKKFNNVDYNVGWQLHLLGTPQPRKIHTEPYHYATYKVCMGAEKCINAGCKLLNKDARPKITKKGIAKQTCALCNEKMEHIISCNAKIAFELRLATITMNRMRHRSKTYRALFIRSPLVL
jgi:hypothetical protein